MTLEEKIKLINPEKYYSALAISKIKTQDGDRLLPWSSPYTFNKKVNDLKYKDVLKPLIEQHEFNKTYKIKGENLINFMILIDKGNIRE